MEIIELFRGKKGLSSYRGYVLFVDNTDKRGRSLVDRYFNFDANIIVISSHCCTLYVNQQ